MDALDLRLENDDMNIIMGLKNNKECREMAPVLERMLIQNFNKDGSDINIGVLSSVYSKEEFSEAVTGGQYQMGIVLEKLNDTPIGQGALKQWKKASPNMRIILVMGRERYATAKVQGLYERGIYDGLFQSDIGRSEMFELIDKPRTKEEAYVYYGLEEYAAAEEKKNEVINENKQEQVVSNIILEPVVFSSKQEKNSEIHHLDIGNVYSENKVNDTVSKLETVSFTEKDLLQEANLPEKETVAEEETGVGKVGLYNNNEEKVIEHPAREVTEDVENKKNTFVELEENKNISVPAEELSFSDSSKGDFVKKNTGSGKHSADTERDSSKEQKEVIQQAKTVKTKSILNNLSDKKMLSDYLEKVNFSLQQTGTVHKTEKGAESPVFEELIHTYGFYKSETVSSVLRGMMDRYDFMSEVHDVIDEYDTDVAEKKDVYEKFNRHLFGYDLLEQLIKMDDVQSIHVLSFDKIRVKKKDGSRATGNLSFSSEQHYIKFIDNLIQRNSNKLIREGMTYNFTDRNFSNKYTLLVSIFDGVSSTDKDLIIQKNINDAPSIEQLVGKRLTLESAAILVHAAQTRKGILFCGPKGSGALRMMQVLLQYIPFNKNGIVLQHRDEFVTGIHPELVVQQPIMKAENREGYSLAQFAEDALQKDIDYYILSEIRGDEVSSLYKAMNYGLAVWTSIKSMDCEGALLSLLDNIMALNPDFNREIVAKNIAEKIDYVVYMEKFKVVHIAHVKENSFNVGTQHYDLSIIDDGSGVNK